MQEIDALKCVLYEEDLSAEFPLKKAYWRRLD